MESMGAGHGLHVRPLLRRYSRMFTACPRITYKERRSLAAGNLLVPSRLQEDAEEALIAVTRCVARGEPLVRCQLLASLFYEELLRQLRQCPDNSDRVILGTAVAQCGRATTASTTPSDLLLELRGVVATLLSSPRPPVSRGRPLLRVIQGGLSKA